MLDTRLRLTAPDDFYEALITTHQGLTEAQSHALNARLVLLLANQIGDHATLCEALHAAGGASAAAATPKAQRAAPVAPVHS